MALSLLEELLIAFEGDSDIAAPTPNTADKHELLICGYFANSNSNRESMPRDIAVLIRSFYPNLKIYGIGLNYYDEFGTTNDGDDVSEFTYLPQMSALCDFDGDINGYGDSFVIFKKLTNEIYAAGPNNFETGVMMVNAERKTTNQFQKMTRKMDQDPISLLVTGHELQNGCFVTRSNKFYVFQGNFKLDEDTRIGETCDFGASLKEEISMKLKNLNIKSVKAGYDHVLFLSTDGAVYSMMSPEAKPPPTNLDWSTIRRRHQFVLHPPTKVPSRVSALSEHFISQIQCAPHSSFFLSASNDLFVSGSNYSGQLGLYPEVNAFLQKNPFFEENKIEIKEIICGHHHTLILDHDGNGFLFGKNGSGQIGNGKTEREVWRPCLLRNVPRIESGFLGGSHSVILCRDHSVYTFGENRYHQCSPLHQRRITEPYALSKEEIGMDAKDTVTRVLGNGQSTLIVVNSFFAK